MSLPNQFNTVNADARTGINLANGVYEAIVMENRDALLMGRLAVYIPELGGNVNDPQSWKTVRYASPFYGITPYKQTKLEAGGGSSNWGNAGGTAPRDATDAEQSQQQQQEQQVITSYGMWAIPPDLGVTVLVMFAGGDLNRGFWFACVPTISHAMVPAIGAPDGKTPMSEFNPIDPQVPVTEDLTSIKRQPYEPLVQQFTAQGINQDPVRGPITSSSFREAPSNVFGISSRSGHNFVLDDGDQNGTSKLIRLRTAGGNQITMHDDSGMIYLINAQGTGWIELSPSGQIDVYGATGINLATNGDINMHADKNVNIHAGNCVKIVGMVGTKVMGGQELQLHGAKTMIEGVDSLHVHTCGELMITSFGDIHMKAFNYFCLKGKCFYWNSCTAKEAEQVPPEQPNDVSGYQTTVARAPSKEPYKEHDNGASGASGAGGGTQADGTNRPAGQSQGGQGVAVTGGPFTGGNAGVPGWWTPERQKYAADYLIKNAGLSQAGAAGLVSRWTLEAPGGPTSVNPYSGASGIAQWLGSRKDTAATSGDFDKQLSKAALELNTTEKRAGDLLRSADNADSAARGATAYERAEYYNSATNTDVLTKQTADRFNTVSNNINKNTAPKTEKVSTPGTSVAASSAATAKIVTPDKDVISSGTRSYSNITNASSASSYKPPTAARSTVMQGAVRVGNNSTVTSTYKPALSSNSLTTANPALSGSFTTNYSMNRPASISVTKTTTSQVGPMATPITTTKTTNIPVSSAAANPYLGRGGAQPVGADPALANVKDPANKPTGIFDSSNPADQAVTGQTPSQEASQALDQTAGQSASSDIPAAPGGGNTGCFATGDNCDRPIDETGGVASGATAEPTGSGDTRGARNNNPGNIRDGAFAKSQPGYVGSDGAFAIFDTPQNGAAAQQTLLNSYLDKGYNTPNSIINRWAPPSENATGNYVNYVTSKTGFGANQVITKAQVPQMAKAMAAMEIGSNNVSKFYP